jgi:ATP-dependent RNA helicase DeaD
MSDQLPDKSFEDFYLSEGMLDTLREIHYVDPTPVQKRCIPLVMAGIDLIVQSQTGTGKTAAFAIPIVEMLEKNPGSVEVLVLAPTRELARQVSKEFGRLADFKGIDVATIYGGTGYGPQYDALETAQIVVATPGRLLDIANRGRIDFDDLRIFGLDEADEMLSMGFAEEVDAIIELLPEERQSLLFSATITEDVKALGKSMLYYPEFITLSSDSVAAEDVRHEYFAVSGVGRARDLLKILELEEPENAIIFANTRAETFAVTRFLKRHGLRAEVLNGDLPQKERERTLAALRQGKIDYLVATDVAARGIDISDLSHVINYTVPDSAEVYVHRTGRTGRAGKKGIALSLLSPNEMATLFNIRKLYEVTMHQRDLPTPNEILEAKKERRIAELDQRLSRYANLPYGGSLGLAKRLVGSETASEAEEIDRVRLVARLIALAEQFGKRDLAEAAALEIREARERAEDVAAPEEKKDAEEYEAADEEEAEEYEAADEEEAEEYEAADEEEAEEYEAAEEDEEEDDKPGRGRRGSRTSRRTRGNGRQEREEDEAPRRRRRRRRKPEEKAEKKAEKKADKKADTRDESPRRSRRSSSKERERGSKKEKTETKIEPAAPTRSKTSLPMSKMWVNMGRDHFEKPDEVEEMVCYMAGMDPDDLGDITLNNSYSYVEVREDYFYDIINAMNNQEWKGVKVTAEPARK